MEMAALVYYYHHGIPVEKNLKLTKLFYVCVLYSSSSKCTSRYTLGGPARMPSITHQETLPWIEAFKLGNVEGHVLKLVGKLWFLQTRSHSLEHRIKVVK